MEDASAPRIPPAEEFKATVLPLPTVSTAYCPTLHTTLHSVCYVLCLRSRALRHQAARAKRVAERVQIHAAITAQVVQRVVVLGAGSFGMPPSRHTHQTTTRLQPMPQSSAS